MSTRYLSDITLKNRAWENELWNYISSGDGVRCPVYDSCKARRQAGISCLSDLTKHHVYIDRLLDKDTITPADTAKLPLNYLGCPRNGRIFKLIQRLAKSYISEAVIKQPPVPSNLISLALDKFPIEIRYVPLKAYHGAVWHLNDCWLVHINSKDTPGRQRFTLYHEIFHILAHCKATPVFKKTAFGQEGSFNEMLAEHFSAFILTPPELVKELWPRVKDISKMAKLFEVPESVVWIGLRHMQLI